VTKFGLSCSARSVRILLWALLTLLGGIALGQAPEPAPTPEGASLKGFDPNGGAGKKVFDVPIEGTIDLGLAPFVERIVGAAGDEDIIALHIKTFGGRVDAAVRIRDALLGSVATTVVYIDRRAISAGALISLACDTIIMSPGASIGAATPVQAGGGGETKPTSEKVVSYMRAEMRATAEAKGRRGDLAEAMVDPDVEIEGVIEEGKLLTLTSDQAVELELADAKADDFETAIRLLNLSGAERVLTHTHWAEKVARVLTGPVVSSLLMTFGVLGLLMELYSPGFGVGGAIGLTCLFLFFFGQYAANLAGWEEVLLFGVGAALILVEILVIPGFGIAGIAGIGLMGTALVMAMMELSLPWDVSFELGYAQEALSSAVIRLAVVMVFFVVGLFGFGKYFPGSGIARWLVFNPAPAPAQPAQTSSLRQDLVGRRGLAKSTLRPAGIADFDGHREQVVTEGDFVQAGSEVEVVQVDGNRVVVKQVG
jgi:membrane-bound serine protease (ClpP class)